jgi:flagellar biosynthetic protein FliR
MDFARYIVMLPVLVLVIARLAGMMVFAPVFSESVVPARLRAMIAVVMALGVVAQVAMPVAMPQSNLAFILAIAGEILIGLAIGYGAKLVFVGIELGAFHASQQMGLSLGEVFNPVSDESSDTLRQFYHLLSLVIFLALGGHRMLISVLLTSFQSVPLMSFVTPQAMVKALTAMLTTSFVLALKVAAPVLLAMLLAGLSLGFVQRTMPQFNLLSTGMPLRILLGLTLIAAILSSGALVDLIGSANSLINVQLRALLEVRP